MIIAEWKPLPELISRLRGHRSILVVGCSTCVAECAAGGEREVEAMAPLLHMALRVEGQEVTVLTRTLERQCEGEFIEELAEVEPRVDAMVSLACGIGVQAVAERFSRMAVYPGVNTTALAVRREPGLWESRCAACGDCLLGETFGLCPIARCAKSLLNGPCGGTRKGGKCELDENTDCIWYQIVERATERGELERLLEVRRARSWAGSRHGGPKRMLREDLRP